MRKSKFYHLKNQPGLLLCNHGSSCWNTQLIIFFWCRQFQRVQALQNISTLNFLKFNMQVRFKKFFICHFNVYQRDGNELSNSCLSACCGQVAPVCMIRNEKSVGRLLWMQELGVFRIYSSMCFLWWIVIATGRVLISQLDRSCCFFQWYNRKTEEVAEAEQNMWSGWGRTKYVIFYKWTQWYNEGDQTTEWCIKELNKCGSIERRTRFGDGMTGLPNLLSYFRHSTEPQAEQENSVWHYEQVSKENSEALIHK